MGDKKAAPAYEKIFEVDCGTHAVRSAPAGLPKRACFCTLAGKQGKSQMMLNRVELIAPCGLDCSLCYRYQRKKDPCPGCRGDDAQKLKSCVNCRIKNCDVIKSGKVRFCADCDQFPCTYVKQLDRSYRRSYGMSVVDNLVRIKQVGLDDYVAEQEKKWACNSCDETLCMHKDACGHCGEPRQNRDCV